MVSGLLRRSGWAVALTLALFGATPSRAGTMFIDFDLSNSRLQIGTAIDVTNGMGGTVSGMARIVFTGVNFGGMITGATAQGQLSDFSLNFDLNAPILPNNPQPIDANLVGPIQISQLGTALGAFDGRAVTFPQNEFNTNFSLHLDCAGSFCPQIAQLAMVTFPITRGATMSNSALFQIGVTNISNFGGAALNASTTIMTDGLFVTLDVRGREVARSEPIPEPVETGLLSLGALVLCGAAAARRLRAA